MTKKWVVLVPVLLLWGTAAFASTWGDNFKGCDSDGSGTVNRAEWTACEGKIQP